jgi:hypothetical protein
LVVRPKSVFIRQKLAKFWTNWAFQKKYSREISLFPVACLVKDSSVLPFKLCSRRIGFSLSRSLSLSFFLSLSFSFSLYLSLSAAEQKKNLVDLSPPDKHLNAFHEFHDEDADRRGQAAAEGRVAK